MPLIELLHDLMSDRAIRRRFNRSPQSVVRKYNLTPTQRRALFTMTPNKLAVGIVDELSSFDFPTDEFPVINENFLPEVTGGAEYPAPTPQAFRVRPRKVSLADLGSDMKFELNIYGQSFSRDATCTIVNDANNAIELVVDHVTIIGTFRCSHLRCIATAVATPDPDYTVTVVNNPGGGNLKLEIDVPGKLTIKN